MTLKQNKSIESINMEALKIFGYKTGSLDNINFMTLFHKSNKEELESSM